MDMDRNLFARGQFHQEDGNIPLVILLAEETFYLNRKEGVRGPLLLFLSFYRIHKTSFPFKNFEIKTREHRAAKPQPKNIYLAEPAEVTEIF
jgi:hypothetical protein